MINNGLFEETNEQHIFSIDELKSVMKSTLTILLTININHCVAWDMSDFVSLENIKTRITWYASQLYIPYYEKYDNSAFFVFFLYFHYNSKPIYSHTTKNKMGKSAFLEIFKIH